MSELRKGEPELSDLNITRGQRPCIAIAGQWMKGRGKFPLLYARGVDVAGGRPLVISTFEIAAQENIPDDVTLITGLDPYDASALERASGLVLPGGGDIDPEWYGCERHPRTHNVSHRRDRFELTLLEAALERDMPVLAICHGMQLLNVYLGGTLDQHLADDAAHLDHDRDMPRSEPVHKVSIEEGSKLARAVGRHSLDVNSHHHQGIAALGRGLERVAWTDDGVLEAVEAKDRSWVAGVQWHPEAMAPVDSRQRAMFEAFVGAARDYHAVEAPAHNARSA